MNAHADADPSTCPECGARRVEGMTCWEQLGMIIAWEADDPELLAEHFLTVATYNLQHPAQFTDSRGRTARYPIRFVKTIIPRAGGRQVV